jgi:hypothetical protein
MRLLRIFTVVFLVAFGVFEIFAQERMPQSIHNENVDLLKSVQVFPNPAADYVHLRFDHLNSADIKLTLHNIIGNEIAVETDIISEHEMRVKVKDLSTGYYLIAIRDDKLQLRSTYKILKR